MADPSPARQRTRLLQDRTLRFAVAVVRACPPDRSLNLPSRELWRQLVRAALSTAGNLEEADEASSRADFIARMKITLREARESWLWLRVLQASELVGHQDTDPLRDEARELSLIYAAIVRNAKAKLERP